MLSLKLYRFLLNFYPATFRENYAGPLEREFLDEYGEAPTRIGVAKLWLRTLADFATSVPMLLAREFREDAWHAIRMWRKRPLPVMMAIAALAIGIGANIGVFSVIDALLLRSLPFREPERLVGFEGYFPVGFDRTNDKFDAWLRNSAYLERAASMLVEEVNLAEENQPAARVKLSETTRGFFDTMGTSALVGRTFFAGEDVKGRDEVAVISYGLWQQSFGGDNRAVGSKLYVNGAPFEVIGVAPPGFDYPNQTQVWTPTVFDPERIDKNAGVNFMLDVGRLKSGMTMSQAQAAMEAEAKASKQENLWGDEKISQRLVPLREQLAGQLRSQSLILGAAVGLLLLIACANVANLLLSRTADRMNELAIRSALGASRARLIQQLLTESLVLSMAGAAASVLVAQWAVKAASLFQKSELSTQELTLGNWRVFAFAASLALVTGLVFGAAPAMFAGSTMIRTTAQRARASRLRSILVAVQIGLTVVLLAGGASLGYAFRKLIATDVGFDSRGVVSLRVAPAGARYAKEGATTGYYNEVARRIRELPGVKGVSASVALPLGTSSFMLFGYEFEGRKVTVATFPVAPGFFSTMGIPMIAGREFDSSDGARASGASGSETLIVVSEKFAQKLVGDPRAIVGRSLKTSNGMARVTGVVKEVRFGGPAVSFAEQSFLMSAHATNLLVRVNGDPHERLASIRQVVQSVDPTIPVHDAMTMDERFADVTARPRFYTLAAALFGACALLLSIVGLYGMISYSVTQRTREMGIRMALGTTPAALRFMMLRQGLLLVVLGAVPGVIVTLFAAQWLEELVAGATALTQMACFASLVPIALVAAFSVWIATSRIAKLDPSSALRVE